MSELTREYPGATQAAHIRYQNEAKTLCGEPILFLTAQWLTASFEPPHVGCSSCRSIADQMHRVITRVQPVEDPSPEPSGPTVRRLIQTLELIIEDYASVGKMETGTVLDRKQAQAIRVALSRARAALISLKKEERE